MVAARDAFVTQNGFSNEATIDQSLATNAFASIDQVGDENEADIDQQNPTAFDPNHTASISQIGDSNYAQILQEGAAGP